MTTLRRKQKIKAKPKKQKQLIAKGNHKQSQISKGS
jgi:hypothetical protein